LFNDSVKGFDKEITMRDIVSNYIYPNTLKVIRVTGSDMKAALERSASYFALDENGELTVSKDFSYPKPQAYNYDMWEGIQYKVDVSKKVGERIVFLEKDGAQIEEEAFYEIVTNAYRAGGGGDYEMFKNKDVVRDITVAMTDLIAEYITKFSPIDVSVNHNWEVIASEKLE
jgi:2',3'-cyclic-nucleotide 2'-phosphodiesterase/3'-nucleotidase